MTTVKCLIILTCALFGAVAATDGELQARANAYIDEFIERSTNKSGGFLDPLPLADLETTFEREIAFIRVKGVAKLYDSEITGLSTMKRKGNVTVLDLDDILFISAQLTIDKVRAAYKGLVQINDLGPKVKLDARIGTSTVTMTVVAPEEGGKVDLMSFDVKFKNARVTIHGLGPWGWAAGLLSSMVINSLEKPVSKFASLKLFHYFSNEVDKIPFPPKSKLTTPATAI